MKILKRVLCLALIVPFAFALVACKQKDDGGSDGGNPPVERTSAQAMALTFDEFDRHSKKQLGTTLSYSSINDDTNDYEYAEYDNYVYAGMKMLKVFSEIENLTENKWYYSDSIEIAELDGYAKQLSKFAVKTQEYSNYNVISVYAFFDIDGKSSETYKKTYDLFFYEIKHYPAIDSISVNMIIEKSRNNVGVNEAGSTASYQTFSMSGGQFLTTVFDRVSEIEDVEDINQITKRALPNYKSLSFNAVMNSVVSEVEPGVEIYTATIQQSIQSSLKTIKRAQLVVLANGIVPEIKIGVMTAAELLNLANAKHISDIAEI